ncbi:hypothetical protein K7G98_29390, partial [Saccharothrix sp. MB29]|nr:hypothetical protein [Saccharothrix sp. MB29]
MSVQRGADPVAGVAPVATSTFVNGHFPRRRWLVVGSSALAGFALTAVWSAHFVDSVIGDNVANALLGHDAGHEREQRARDHAADG